MHVVQYRIQQVLDSWLATRLKLSLEPGLPDVLQGPSPESLDLLPSLSQEGYSRLVAHPDGLG